MIPVEETGELWGIAACIFNDGEPRVLAMHYAIGRWITWIEGNIRVVTAPCGQSATLLSIHETAQAPGMKPADLFANPPAGSEG